MHLNHFPQHPHSTTNSQNYSQHNGFAPQVQVGQPQSVEHNAVSAPTHNERIMYKSTIQPQTIPLQQMNVGMGRLELMGRNVREEV